jgi:hypothetical protein
MGPGEVVIGDHRDMATCGAGCAEETAAPVHGCCGSQAWAHGNRRAQAALLDLAAGDVRGAALPGGAQAGGHAAAAGDPGAGGWHTGSRGTGRAQ